MSDQVISGSEMITNVFKNICASDIEKNNKILNAWRDTVSKISGNGEKLAAHSYPVDLKNGVLLVESDHPGWNQMLQMHKKFILTGLNRLSGGVAIETLAFKVKGSGAALADKEELERKAVEKYAQKIDAEQKKLEEMGYGSQDAAAGKEAGKGQESLPPELNEIFERMKKTAKDYS